MLNVITVNITFLVNEINVTNCNIALKKYLIQISYHKKAGKLTSNNSWPKKSSFNKNYLNFLCFSFFTFGVIFSPDHGSIYETSVWRFWVLEFEDSSEQRLLLLQRQQRWWEKHSGELLVNILQFNWYWLKFHKWKGNDLGSNK